MDSAAGEGVADKQAVELEVHYCSEQLEGVSRHFHCLKA